MSTEPGWYPRSDGRQRYWDGQQWTQHLAPVAALATHQSAGPITGQPYPVDELDAARSEARRIVLVGLAILAVGVAITWGTYAAPGPGGAFFAAWGPIVFGLYRLGTGLFYLANPGRLLKKASSQ